MKHIKKIAVGMFAFSIIVSGCGNEKKAETKEDSYKLLEKAYKDAKEENSWTGSYSQAISMKADDEKNHAKRTVEFEMDRKKDVIHGDVKESSNGDIEEYEMQYQDDKVLRRRSKSRNYTEAYGDQIEKIPFASKEVIFNVNKKDAKTIKTKEKDGVSTITVEVEKKKIADVIADNEITNYLIKVLGLDEEEIEKATLTTVSNIDKDGKLLSHDVTYKFTVEKYGKKATVEIACDLKIDSYKKVKIKEIDKKDIGSNFLEDDKESSDD